MCCQNLTHKVPYPITFSICFVSWRLLQQLKSLMYFHQGIGRECEQSQSCLKPQLKHSIYENTFWIYIPNPPPDLLNEEEERTGDFSVSVLRKYVCIEYLKTAFAVSAYCYMLFFLVNNNLWWIMLFELKKPYQASVSILIKPCEYPTFGASSPKSSFRRYVKGSVLSGWCWQ